MLLSTLILSTLLTLASGQCTGDDALNCPGWIANGFCSDAGYSMDLRKQYCGVSCGFCNTDGTQTAAGGGTTYTACTDANANCATWNASGFCANQTISNSLKLLYCCNTCRATLLATTTTTTGSTSTTTTTTTTTVAPGK